MTPSFKLLALACLSLPLLACTEDPAAELTPIACGRLGCNVERPLAAGAKMAFQAYPLGVVKAARTTDPTIATIAAGYPSAIEGWTVTSLKAGTSTIELLDEGGDVVGTHEVSIARADHLEATIKVIQATGTTQLDRVLAEQPQPVPAAATVLITVDPRIGAEPLLGWSEYTIDATLTGGARIVQQDTEGNALVRLGSGDQAIRFRTGALDGRFMLTAR